MWWTAKEQDGTAAPARKLTFARFQGSLRAKHRASASTEDQRIIDSAGWVGDRADPEKHSGDANACKTRSPVSDFQACYSRESAGEVAFCESQVSVCRQGLGNGKKQTLGCRGPIATGGYGWPAMTLLRWCRGGGQRGQRGPARTGQRGPARARLATSHRRPVRLRESSTEAVYSSLQGYKCAVGACAAGIVGLRLEGRERYGESRAVTASSLCSGPSTCRGLSTTLSVRAQGCHVAGGPTLREASRALNVVHTIQPRHLTWTCSCNCRYRLSPCTLLARGLTAWVQSLRTVPLLPGFNLANRPNMQRIAVARPLWCRRFCSPAPAGH